MRHALHPRRPRKPGSIGVTVMLTGTPLPPDATARILAGAVSVGVMLHDGTGTILYCNRAGAALLGVPYGQLRGRRSVDLGLQAVREDGSPFLVDAFPPEVTRRTRLPVQDVVLGVQQSDGVLRWVRVDSTPLDEPDDDGVSVVTTLEDVTERGHLEELLAFQAAVATLPVGILVGENAPGERPRVVAYNDHFREMVGAPPAEGAPLGGMPYRIFEPDRRTELHPSQWPGPLAARLGKAVVGTELHVLRGDGTWRVLHTSAVPVRSSPRGAAVVVSIDVTAQQPGP